MKILDTRITDLKVANYLEGNTELTLKADVTYNLNFFEDRNGGVGTLILNIEDVNDDNDYPFLINIRYQGAFEYVIGEEVDRQSMRLIYSEMKKFLAKLTKEMGISPIELPNAENMTIERQESSDALLN